jgi:secreted trypsin-like serine protease
VRILFLQIFLLLSFPELAGAIQGGERVAEGSSLARLTVSLQVQLGDKGEWWTHCSAVIWADDLVITAAHCLPEPGKKAPLRIAFTTDTRGASFESRPVTGYVRQEGFQTKILHEVDDHDLGLIRIAHGLPPGFNRARIIMPEESALLGKGSPAILTGFGSIVYDSYDVGIMRSTTVPVANPWNGQTEVLLDQRAKGGACSGDSGGPAFLEKDGQLILWGITSRAWPLRVNDCSQYMIYTRLDTQWAWLKDAAAKLR